VEFERKRAIDRAEAAGYLPHIRALAKNATVPLWWSRSSPPTGRAILNNATMCAVNTGEKTICVTAGHVYSKYLQHSEEFDDLVCQMGNVRVKLDDYLIDYNLDLDLATFDVSPILLAGSGISEHAPRTWPPVCLRESDIVILGGYPGLLRQERPGQVGLPFVSFLGRVAQVSSDHSAVQLNIEASYWPDGSGGIPARSELGGMSGGPILRYHSETVEYFEIVGFIYEASTEYELIFVRHASCISRSGFIAGSL